MPMTLVKGHHRIVGASPDGDFVRFYPQDPDVWSRAGIAVRTNSTGGVQLRLDAIDALETHSPHRTRGRRGGNPPPSGTAPPRPCWTCSGSVTSSVTTAGTSPPRHRSRPPGTS